MFNQNKLFLNAMKSSMTLFGCGPKLAILSLPYIVLSLAVMFIYPEFLELKFLDNSYFRIMGYFWLGLGFAFWIYSAVYFLKNFEPGKLITCGPFGLCRIPEQQVNRMQNLHVQDYIFEKLFCTLYNAVMEFYAISPCFHNGTISLM
jgi:hypothetical protein